jgi:heme-degrading monooxygenase HmoA
MNVHYAEWHIVPFRADRWFAIWRPALDRALAYGAQGAFITRNEDDPLHFRQVTMWENRADQERWWFSDELSALREETFKLYIKPVDTHWHDKVADAAVQLTNGAPGT